MSRANSAEQPDRLSAALGRAQTDLRAALIVTRREVNDALRDWRMMLPIALLVLVFPLLANLIADTGLRFVGQYGASISIDHLFPMLTLVVGFVPATFSLMIALETFVGEKERGSLEPLLATPLTDFQLYLGKFIASTILPVLASFLGIAVYTALLGVTAHWWTPLSLLLLAMVLSVLMSIVMVAVAVIVSSQSASVRGSNLVAGFIIVPMTLLLEVEAALLLYGQYRALWLMTLALLVVSIILVRLGVRIFNRENLLGRGLDRVNLVGAWRVFRQALFSGEGPVGFYRSELPRIFRGLRAELVVTGLVMFVGGLSVGLWGKRNFPLPLGALGLGNIPDPAAMNSLVAQSGLLPSFSVGAVLWNNARSLLVAAGAGLFSLGTLALLLLMAPIAIIAYVALQIGQVGLNPWVFVAVAVLPHGVFELPAAILATAQAMRIGDVILRPPSRGGGAYGIVREIAHFLKLFLLVVLPLLAIAALVEVNVTPRLLAWYLSHAG